MNMGLYLRCAQITVHNTPSEEYYSEIEKMHTCLTNCI